MAGLCSPSTLSSVKTGSALSHSFLQRSRFVGSRTQQALSEYLLKGKVRNAVILGFKWMPLLNYTLNLYLLLKTKLFSVVSSFSDFLLPRTHMLVCTISGSF